MLSHYAAFDGITRQCNAHVVDHGNVAVLIYAYVCVCARDHVCIQVIADARTTNVVIFLENTMWFCLEH